MVKRIIEQLGTVRVANACGVTPAAVSIWKRKGHLPKREGSVKERGDRFAEIIATMAGVPVEQLQPEPKKQDQ